MRRLYEPLCAPISERLAAIRALRAAGIETYATLAPLLPCDPEELVRLAIEASGRDLIGDPLHVRATKQRGATTREASRRISARHGFEDWHDFEFQSSVVGALEAAAERAGYTFSVGPRGFSKLAATS